MYTENYVTFKKKNFIFKLDNLIRPIMRLEKNHSIRIIKDLSKNISKIQFPY